jgi:hypothetical protein
VTTLFLSCVDVAGIGTALGVIAAVACVVDIRHATWDYTRPTGPVVETGPEPAAAREAESGDVHVAQTSANAGAGARGSGFARRLGDAVGWARTALKPRRRRLDG